MMTLKEVSKIYKKFVAARADLANATIGFMDAPTLDTRIEYGEKYLKAAKAWKKILSAYNLPEQTEDFLADELEFAVMVRDCSTHDGE